MGEEGERGSNGGMTNINMPHSCTQMYNHDLLCTTYRPMQHVGWISSVHVYILNAYTHCLSEKNYPILVLL